MRVRFDNPLLAADQREWTLGTSSEFTPGEGGEVVIHFDKGPADSYPITSLEVWIAGQGWMKMTEAFTRKLLIPDNYNRRFRVPITEAEQERGWYE